MIETLINPHVFVNMIVIHHNPMKCQTETSQAEKLNPQLYVDNSIWTL